MKIQIKPIPVAFGIEANHIELKQGEYILGSNDKCQVKCSFFKDNDLVNDSTVVEVPKELVQNWQEDDLLIDYVINELGLLVIPNNQEVL